MEVYMSRLLVWFTNGLYKEFPKCTKVELDKNTNLVEVVFGSNHYTVINMNNVNFIELLDEKE